MLSRTCVFRFLYKQNNTSIQSKITANHSTGPVLNLPTPNKNHVRYVSLTWISRNCVIPNLSLFCNMQWQLETQHAKFGDCAISFDRIIANLNWWVPAWKYHFLAYFHFQTLFYEHITGIAFLSSLADLFWSSFRVFSSMQAKQSEEISEKRDF